MIKIFLTVRNRLSITKKCIEAIKRNSMIENEIYVYDNHSTYRVKEHFDYFNKLYEQGDIVQVTFTTETSTFNAFSKATACNMFGQQHEMDPNKAKYKFLLFLDNDIILTPAWDKKILRAWKFVKQNKLNHIKVIGQKPGGIKNIRERYDIEGMKAAAGYLGGSGLWAVRTNFFTDVGYLNLNDLVGHDKRHDQLYWRKLQGVSGGKPYILGLATKLGVHCGKIAGSVCNRLSKNRGKSKEQKHAVIQFDRQETEIDKMSFEDFYKNIVGNEELIKDW